MVRRYRLAPLVCVHKSSAGSNWPFSHMSGFMFMPKPSMVWYVREASTVRFALPETAGVTVTAAEADLLVFATLVAVTV